MGNFCQKIYHQEVSKIAQSGHTAATASILIVVISQKSVFGEFFFFFLESEIVRGAKNRKVVGPTFLSRSRSKYETSKMELTSVTKLGIFESFWQQMFVQSGQIFY